MDNYLIKGETLTAIGDSIRTHTQSTDLVYPENMPQKIGEVYDKGYSDGVNSGGGSAELPNPSINVDSNGRITATVGEGDNKKSTVIQLTTKGATTITPKSTAQVAISSGIYTTGDITIAGDSKLIASNIKSGTSIFGVTGTYGNTETGNLYVEDESWVENGLDVLYDEVQKQGKFVIGRVQGSVSKLNKYKVNQLYSATVNINKKFRPAITGTNTTAFMGTGYVEFSSQSTGHKTLPINFVYNSKDKSLGIAFMASEYVDSNNEISLSGFDGTIYGCLGYESV